ncbi:MAG: hypothetical protein AAFX93_12495 [Verrucomicrobiota bacterium]
MNSKAVFLLSALLLIVGLAVGSSLANANQIGVQRVKWDYTITSTPFSLQALGDDGWELVAVSREPNRQGSVETRYYFKRPK